jgi:hypothetical protein
VIQWGTDPSKYTLKGTFPVWDIAMDDSGVTPITAPALRSNLFQGTEPTLQPASEDGLELQPGAGVSSEPESSPVTETQKINNAWREFFSNGCLENNTRSALSGLGYIAHIGDYKSLIMFVKKTYNDLFGTANAPNSIERFDDALFHALGNLREHGDNNGLLLIRPSISSDGKKVNMLRFILMDKGKGFAHKSGHAISIDDAIKGYDYVGHGSNHIGMHEINELADDLKVVEFHEAAAGLAKGSWYETSKTSDAVKHGKLDNGSIVQHGTQIAVTNKVETNLKKSPIEKYSESVRRK